MIKYFTKFSGLWLIFNNIIGHDATRTGQTGRKVNRHLARDLILFQILADELNTLFALDFLAKIGLIIRDNTAGILGLDQIEYILRLEEMIVVCLAVFNDEILNSALVRFKFEHGRYFGLEKVLLHLGHPVLRRWRGPLRRGRPSPDPSVDRKREDRC